MELSFIKKQELKDKSTPYLIGIVFLSLSSLVLLLLPVIVNFMNRFSTIDSNSDIVYYILKGIFGVSIAVSLSLFVIKKEVSVAAIPCLLGFITSLFPLYENTSRLINAYSMAQQLSMHVGFGPYLISVGEYLLYALLSVFTLLFCIGRFRYILIIMLLSVIGSLATVFTCVDNYVTYEISVYEILSFGYTALLCLVPLLIVLSVKLQSKGEKYKARRMK